MANWLTHLRIAEKVMQKLNLSVNIENYYVGSVAADSSAIVYDAYVRNENNFDKKSFYLGYYIHLITDSIWTELVARPVVERFKTHEEYTGKAEQQFRGDLLVVKLIFLMNNPEFRTLVLLKTIRTFNNIYLDYFPQNAFEIKIEEVIKTYQDFSIDSDRIFPYCSYEHYEHYEQMVTLAANLIAMSLLSK